MSEERLQEIKNSVEFQYTLAKAKGYDNALLFTNEEEELIEEVERLKKREQECIDHYLVQCKYASEMEDKYITANNIINELEKWLEEEKDRLARETSNIYEDSLGKTRLVNEDIFNEVTKIKSKLQELKGVNKE